MFLDTRFGNVPQWSLSMPPDYDMRVPEAIRDCVVFLGQRTVDADGRESLRLDGTAFVVSVPSERSQSRHLYLVTAKHCIDALSGQPSFEIRMNLRGGGWMLAASRLGDWWFHPTDPECVDVAVAPFCPVPNVQFHSVDTGIFLTDKHITERRIGPGDEVVIVGLFTKLEGQSKNIPLVRIGNVAMLPDNGELFKIKIGNDFRDVEIYLLEARSIGGLSGSPVFARETVEFSGHVTYLDGSRVRHLCHVPGAFYLIGLAARHWEIDMKDRNKVVFPSVNPRTNPDAVNLGIAIIVPAKKILEVLNQPKLAELRRKADVDAARRQAAESETQQDASPS